ncbi:hypothetical protein HK105_202901 [Polyrhizophydium stewartii]|uniref:Uncharacterized protein n=1 Tax=Polyrhizophydium stewartii TaxID=2732419 RepID=A0ABR4NDK2_9FUNG
MSSAILIQQQTVNGLTFMVEYDSFLIAVSFWTAAMGAFTAIQVMNQLLPMYRKYIVVNVGQLLNKLPRIKSPVLRWLYGLFHINPQIILSLFLVATALGGCCIWSVHFLGMHCLRFTATRDGVRSTLPFFNPFTERVTKNYIFVIPVYYESSLIVLSLLTSIGALFLGLLVAAFGAGMIYTRISPSDLYKLVKRHVSGFEGPPVQRTVVPDANATTPRGSPTSTEDTSRIVTIETAEPNPSTHSQAASDASAPQESLDRGLGATIDVETTSFFGLSAERKLIFVLGAAIMGAGIVVMYGFSVASLRIPGVRILKTARFVYTGIAIVVFGSIATLWIMVFLRGRTQRMLICFVIGGLIVLVRYMAIVSVKFELTQDPMDTDYSEFFERNPTAVSGNVIETLRAQVTFTIELVILAVGFRMLHLM